MRIEIAGERLEPLAEKALYWPRLRTLFIADPHWGKATAFRAAGVAVSPDPLGTDLARLRSVLESTEATRLVILGDLFHAKAGKSPAVLGAVADWRNGFPNLNVLLIRGNHDRHAGDPPAEWRFECRGEPVLEPPFAYRHFPGSTPGHYTLAGHLHPAATLRGPARQQLRFPCFHFGGVGAVLPAFGSFTGNADVTPAAGDRVFVIADGEVVEVN